MGGRMPKACWPGGEIATSLQSDEWLMSAYSVYDDEKSFEILYSRHFKPVFVYQRRAFNFISRPDAEELTEDTFLKLILKKRSYIGERSFRPWLFKIASNIKIDFIRRKK